MMIKIEPDLRGRAASVDLVYDVGEATPFRVTISASHQCMAEDLYRLAVAMSEFLIPAALVTSGRGA